MKTKVFVLIMVVVLCGVLCGCAPKPTYGEGTLTSSAWVKTAFLTNGEKIESSGYGYDIPKFDIAEGEAILPGSEVTEYLLIFKDDQDNSYVLVIKDPVIWESYGDFMGKCYSFYWMDAPLERRMIESGTQKVCK